MVEVRDQDEGGAPSRADRDVIDAMLRAVTMCETGLDDDVLTAMHDALRARVTFDRLVVSVEDEDGKAFRVFARSSSPFDGPGLFPSGARVPFDSVLEGFRSRADGSALTVVVENVDERRTPLDRVLLQAGVRSYVSVPIQTGESGRTWLTLTHRESGAPSKSALALLSRIARALAPAFARARALLRTRLLATLVDASPDGMLALDLTCEVREANQAALRLLGKTRASVVGHHLKDVIGAVSATRIMDVLASKPENAEVALTIASHGEELPIDARVGTIVGTAEATFHIHLRDARERRSAEEAMARRLEQLSFLRALGESLGSDLRVRTAVERALDVCIARRPIGAIAALRADDSGTLRLVAARGASPDLTARVSWIRRDQLESLRPDGRWSLVLPLSHARRTWGALFIVGGDMGPLPEPERELWDSVRGMVAAALHAAQDFEHVVELEAEKRLLVDSLPVVVARVEPALAWSTSFVNGAAERILGVAPSELNGLPGLDGMLQPSDQIAAREARRRASLGEKVGWEDRRYRHKDGRELTLREYVYPVHDVDGTVRSVQVIAYDVTTEIESRQRLVQADRLASLGALAAGIAHEINNPVAFIGLAAGQIPRQTDAERVRELSHEVGEAANRIAHIVGELKLFTRIPDGASATPVDVNRMLQTAVTLTSAEIRRRARLDVTLGDLPLVPGRFSGLGPAFVNLLLNAAQAVDRAALGGPRVVAVRSSSHSESIVIEFIDTGPGIRPEHLTRIFDPFFAADTGKHDAGLGLAIAYDLVRRVGGDIRVTSSLGEGSKFEIALPLDASDSFEEGTRPAPRRITFEKPSVVPGPDADRRRVLIIDDELALAKALARQLSSGYDVDTASTASDALAQLAIHSYDAIVCDLRMPDQSGPSIHQAVSARSSAQASRFIFTTGGSYGTSDDEIHERARATGRPVLEKPFDGPSFEALVGEVAERGG